MALLPGHGSRALIGGLALAAVVIALAPVTKAGSAGPTVLAAYTLTAPRSMVPSGLVARAVLPGGLPCPTMLVHQAGGADERVSMKERVPPSTTAPAFAAITVCSASIPAGVTSASIDGRAIPASMPAAVHRLAMFGDSGCRIAGTWVQDCADPTQWPLARIAQSVAEAEPDVILFTGDFFYRESPCPTANQAWCGTSPPPLMNAPFTDSAYGWLADAIVPMSPMFASAPMVAMRGNHEECSRAGNGYFLLFDPRPDSVDTCAPTLVEGVLTAPAPTPTDSYAIDLPITDDRTLRLAVVDSNGGNDLIASPYAAVQRVAYQQAAQLARPAAGRESWLLTHRPIYGFVTNEFAVPGVPFSPWSSADQAAAAWGLLDPYDLVVSSHLHQVEAVQLPGLPGQLVVGNGGTFLDPTVGYPLPTTGANAGDGRTYPAPPWAWNQSRFGYVIAEPQAQPGSWRFSMRDPDGRVFGRCGLKERQIFCRTAS